MTPSFVERIRELEARARPLEPDAPERERTRETVVGYTEAFLERLPRRPIYRGDPEPARGLREVPIGEEPHDPARVVRLLEEAVDAAGLHPAHPGHLGYIPGGGLPSAALGDYIAAITNHYAGISFAGPGAVEVENQLLRWMAERVGYPSDAGGNLASGGSVANLVAVVTAREARGLRARDFHRAVVYTTGQVHHCVEKALVVAGLGEAIRRRVPTDDRHRMDAEALDGAIRRDREAGLLPWLVVASAGTTDVGAVDPLEAVGAVAREHGLWYHVDAAYGGFFVLCPETQPVLRGLETADSLVLDPHKGLFLPYGLGAVLVRDDDALVRAHRYQAAYMQDAESPNGGLGRSPAKRSPELSKHWRGLRMWLPLMLHGVAAFRAALQEKLLLARHFHRAVADLGFETGPEPELSLFTFRWVPAEGDANEFNRALVRAIHDDGRVFLTSTTVDGAVVLRACVLSVRTHLDTVETALRVLREKVAELEGRSAPAGRAPSASGPEVA